MNDETAGVPRGPEDVHESPRAHPMAGDFVTETLPEYDGGRQVTVYVPPDPPEAVVFAGDGQGFSKWGRFLESTDAPPTMIIGVHGLTEEMPRLHEYSPGFDVERFAAHERFFVDDVRRWVRERFGVALPAERSAVCGEGGSSRRTASGTCRPQSWRSGGSYGFGRFSGH